MQISSKPVLRVAAALLAFAIIAGILLFANGLVGNPISRMLANRSARRYVASTYSDRNLELEKARYDFKSGSYYVHVKSSKSIDTRFSLNVTPSGKVRYDDHEFRVLGKSNTFERINDEYRQAIRRVIDAGDFPYKSYIGYGEIAPYYERKDFGPLYGLVLDELALDKVYDVMGLAETAGHIVLYIEDETVTVTRAAEILLNLKSIFASKGISFYAIDFDLIKPRGDDKPALDEPRVSVQDFLYEDIYEEGLAERVAAADQALREYYAEQDAKQKLE
jgi:hypothetical protein